MTTKISRLISAVMLAAAVLFSLYALNHPDASFPVWNAITCPLYCLALLVIVVLACVPFLRNR